MGANCMIVFGRQCVRVCVCVCVRGWRGDLRTPLLRRAATDARVSLSRRIAGCSDASGEDAAGGRPAVTRGLRLPD